MTRPGSIGLGGSWKRRTRIMSAISAVDVDHLRRTLTELGYHEQLSTEAAPLVHHILADLNLSTKQYNDLLQHYDDLFARWQSETASTPPKRDSLSLGMSQLSGLDLSMLGIDSRNLDESFMLRAVEEARLRLESLQVQVETLKGDNTKLTEEKNALASDLQRAHSASQELSQVLNTKRALVDNLQSELVTLKKKSDSNFTFQLLNIVKNAISFLPAELQSSYAFKLIDNETPEALLVVLSTALQRIKQDLEAKASQLRESNAEIEKVRGHCFSLEESALKLKTGITQYQGQIAELNNRIYEKDVENSMQGDLQTQLKHLERLNDTIREKVALLDRLKQENPSGSSEFAQVTVQTILESLTTELHAEVGFSSHLNQIVEKLNARRLEQDKELSSLQQKVREAEEKVLRAEHEKVQLKGQLERALNDVVRKDGALATTDEVIKNLQQALEAKQGKIDEQKSTPYHDIL